METVNTPIELKVGMRVVWCVPGAMPDDSASRGTILEMGPDIEEVHILVHWDLVPPSTTYHTRHFLVPICPFCDQPREMHRVVETGYHCLFGPNTWVP